MTRSRPSSTSASRARCARRRHGAGTSLMRGARRGPRRAPALCETHARARMPHLQQQQPSRPADQPQRLHAHERPARPHAQHQVPDHRERHAGGPHSGLEGLGRGGRCAARGGEAQRRRQQRSRAVRAAAHRSACARRRPCPQPPPRAPRPPLLPPAVLATGSIPPGNAPGETKWQSRAVRPAKPEIRLTAGKPITGVTMEQLVDQVRRPAVVVRRHQPAAGAPPLQRAACPAAAPPPPCPCLG
jgi:hypothetical protein